MADSKNAPALIIRIFPAEPHAPDLYPVEATLSDAWTVDGKAMIPVAALVEQADPWECGRQLAQALFADPNLQRALNYARGRGPQVSLGLQIDPEAEALWGLPWERMLFVQGSEDLAFAASPKVAFSRRVPSQQEAFARHGGPFRLLLVVASPNELQAEGSKMSPIDIAGEIGSLRTAWDGLVKRGLMRVSIVGRVPDDLATELNGAGYMVTAKPATLDLLSDQVQEADSLHLICHGSFKNGTTSLLLEKADGGASAVPEGDFLPRLGAGRLRLVFLQACQTAGGARSSALSGLAPKVALQAAGVVAMQDYVRMEDAKRFAQQFYETLLSTGFADRAANAGREVLYRPGSTNWSIPSLYLNVSPDAAQLWHPDDVLRAVQDMAEKFRERDDVKTPFPIEVIRLHPDVSAQMETSPPGPRVRVVDAVAAALAQDGEARTRTVVIAGNYGRAKTAQLYSLYVHHAAHVSRGQRVPYFLQAAEFPLSEDTPTRLLVKGIQQTYRRFDIDVSGGELLKRLEQPYLLCVDAGQATDARRRRAALRCVQAVVSRHPDAAAVVTLDLEHIPEMQALDSKLPILLIQLMSAGTVAQHLMSLGEGYKPLLKSIQDTSLFDLAGVPWLFSHLIQNAARGIPSRSGVISRIVDDNMSSTDLSPGVMRIVDDLLGRIAWSLQTHQTTRLDGARLYEVLDQVRGRRELQLEELRAAALSTKILTVCDDDGVRFSYPGFQSHFCAQYLLNQPSGLSSKLDDIAATLGRRSRVRHWEDVLVLLSGLMGKPDELIAQVLASGGMSQGEHAFLAARCLHEARLSGRPVSEDITTQVVDSLVWRSTPEKESSASLRIQATTCLGLMKDPATIPHLVSLAIEKVRPVQGPGMDFELSGLRHAALQVLLTMSDETTAFVQSRIDGPNATARGPELMQFIERWSALDCKGLVEMFRTTPPDGGLRAVIAFALAMLGDDNLEFLSEEILDPNAAVDTTWSIADSLLHFNPAAVTKGAIASMRELPALHAQAAYMIGCLRVAAPDSAEVRFLQSCLASEDAKTQGIALRSLAQLGQTEFRPLCEAIVTESWTELGRAKTIAVPKKAGDRQMLRYYALEGLRLIGDKGSLEALRKARNTRAGRDARDRPSAELTQLSYEVGEDVYWRVHSRSEGDTGARSRE